MQQEILSALDNVNAQNKIVCVNGKKYTIHFSLINEPSLIDVINVGATGFPGEVEAIASGMKSIFLPKKEWTFPGAESVDENYLHCFVLNLKPAGSLNSKGIPVGITGLYKIVEHPEEAWMGWTTLIPQVRGLGLGKDLVECFEEAASKDLSCKVVRAWSVENELRFGGQHKNLTQRHNYSLQIFGGGEHGAGKYGIYSKNILGNKAVEECPDATEMAGGTDMPLPDTPNLVKLLNAFQKQAKRHNAKATRNTIESSFYKRIMGMTFKEALDFISESETPPSLNFKDTRILAALVQYSQEAGSNYDAPVKEILSSYNAKISAIIGSHRSEKIKFSKKQDCLSL